MRQPSSRRVFLLAPRLALMAWSIAAHAAAASPTPVSEFVVPGGPPPRVAATFPTEGTEVPAGVLILKVAFDRPMAPGAWSYAPAEGGAFPNCLARPRLLADQRTFILLCTVAARGRYAIAINEAPAFASQGGRTARMTVLRFTTADTGPRGLHDALVQAGLTDADDPIMRWRDEPAP